MTNAKILENFIEIIEKQQEGHSNDDVFMVGEQLKDIASREPSCIEILVQDLQTDKMGISDAAAKIRQYADKNRKGAKCFCVSPTVAEGILREFYGLPAPGEAADEKTEAVSGLDYIDLGDFL